MVQSAMQKSVSHCKMFCSFAFTWTNFHVSWQNSLNFFCVACFASAFVEPQIRWCSVGQISPKQPHWNRALCQTQNARVCHLRIGWPESFHFSERIICLQDQHKHLRWSFTLFNPTCAASVARSSIDCVCPTLFTLPSPLYPVQNAWQNWQTLGHKMHVSGKSEMVPFFAMLSWSIFHFCSSYSLVLSTVPSLESLRTPWNTALCDLIVPIPHWSSRCLHAGSYLQGQEGSLLFTTHYLAGYLSGLSWLRIGKACNKGLVNLVLPKLSTCSLHFNQACVGINWF